MDGRTDGQADGRTYRRTDGWTDGRTEVNILKGVRAAEVFSTVIAVFPKRVLYILHSFIHSFMNAFN